jgi:choline-sulfatase
VSRRPNLLLIMVDQLAAQWLPAYGNSVVHAPALTGLASESVVFDAAYCASPLCAPSRAAMLCGRGPSAVGVFDNAAELPASVPTFVHPLRTAGYRTCLAGKMHFVGPDQLHGFERRLTTDVYPASLDWTPDWTQPVTNRLRWYHSVHSVLEPAQTVASMQTDYDDEVAFQAVREVHDLARAGEEDPFLLVVSFTNPHDPWEVPPRYWDLYDPASISGPSVGLIPFDEADPHSQRLRIMSGIDQASLSDADVRRARHGYYAAISYVDERIGSVLDALRATGLDSETIVVFTADHGEFLGERGLWYKMSFLEPAARVPLFVRVPTAAAGSVTTPVSLVDLAPTVLELCGVDGAGMSTAGPSFLSSEGVNAPAAMIRDGRFKLILCREDPDQLYDLASDPLELSNLASMPSHASTVDRLREALAERLDLAAIERRVLASQRERHLVAAALNRGEVTAWDYEPYVDATKQYVRAREDLYDLQRSARLDAR